MCHKGHLGMVGITGLEPGWEKAVRKKRNELLGALYAAVPQGASLEKVIDPDFEQIDAILATLLNKLKIRTTDGDNIASNSAQRAAEAEK